MLNNEIVINYLEKRSFPNTLLSQMLAWKEENQAEADETAIYFLETHEDVWKNWVSADAMSKVKASM